MIHLLSAGSAAEAAALVEGTTVFLPGSPLYGLKARALFRAGQTETALAVAEGKHDRAARLFGAADAQRIQSGLVLQAADHPAMRAILADAPEFAGSDVEAARREGRLLSLEAATELAVSRVDRETV